MNFDYSKVKGSTELHNKFKKETMIAISEQYPDVIVLPYDVGVFRAFSEPEKIVRCGQDGCGDLIILGNSWYLILDNKTGKNTLQPNQKNFKKRVASINSGFEKMFKITTVKQALDLVERQQQDENHR